jgi:hypothetical protein
MNTCRLSRHPLSTFLIAFAIIPLLLSACQPINASTNLPPVQPTITQLPTIQPAPTQTAQSSSNAPVTITLDLSGVAQNQTIETVAAFPPSPDAFYTVVMPQYTLVTLQGYPVTGSSMKSQIFVYPLADLAGYNQAAGQVAVDLQTLLQSRRPGDSLPFLPLINAKQVMHPQVQYLDFNKGKGVRFLTWYSQGMLRVNNTDLIYTFQGVTGDGKYYIAAVLPVNHAELPATQEVFATTEDGLKDYPAYLTKTATWLEQQPGASFTPDLAKLDGLIQSIVVK